MARPGLESGKSRFTSCDRLRSTGRIPWKHNGSEEPLRLQRSSDRPTDGASNQAIPDEAMGGCERPWSNGDAAAPETLAVPQAPTGAQHARLQLGGTLLARLSQPVPAADDDDTVRLSVEEEPRAEWTFLGHQFRPILIENFLVDVAADPRLHHAAGPQNDGAPQVRGRASVHQSRIPASGSMAPHRSPRCSENASVIAAVSGLRGAQGDERPPSPTRTGGLLVYRARRRVVRGRPLQLRPLHPRSATCSAERSAVAEQTASPGPAWVAEFPYDRCLIWRRRFWLSLGEQLLPCHHLLATGDALVKQHWNLRPDSLRARTEHWSVMLLLYRRATTCYQGLLLLLREGFAEQAVVQLRVLFECMLDLYWVGRHPEEAVESLIGHTNFHEQDLRTKLGQDPEYEGPLPDSEALDPKEARALRRRFGSSFTGENLYQRIQAWEDDDRAELRFSMDRPGQLRWTYNSLIHHANLLVHGSMHGLAPGTERIRAGNEACCT
jgi:hypothetical protein